MTTKEVSGYINPEILDKATAKWGVDSQIEMMKEESIELALALQKLNRLRGDMAVKISAVIDELADVKIMLTQMERIFDQDKINARVDFKMNRLEKRIIDCEM